MTDLYELVKFLIIILVIVVVLFLIVHFFLAIFAIAPLGIGHVQSINTYLPVTNNLIS